MMHRNKFFLSPIRTLSTERLLCRLVAVLLVVQSTVALLVPLWLTNVIARQ